MRIPNPCKKIICVLVGLIGSYSLIEAAPIYVDHNFQGTTPSGESWLSAFASLQHAIDFAAESNGGEIWVKAGVYKPDGLSKNAAFSLKPNIHIFGGFRGYETELGQRNPKANRTFLSGDIGRLGRDNDNAFHVLIGASNMVIDGFTISHGSAKSAGDNRFGGGLRIPPNTKQARVNNCSFEKNQAEFGGAIHVDSAELSISNCTFYSNSANAGGAIGVRGNSMLSVNSSSFASNFAPNQGGAIFAGSESRTDITNSSFIFNSTDGVGGAISAASDQDNDLSFNLTLCIFNKNTAKKTGGALAFSGKFSPVIRDCEFRANYAQKGAGALANKNGIIAVITNATYSDNRGTKNSVNFSNDESSQITDSATQAHQRTLAVEPSPQKTKPQQDSHTETAPKPKPQRTLPNTFAYNLKNQQVKLHSLVAPNKITVFILGELTDPDFIASYRNAEAAALDFLPKGVHFYYIYRHLKHPENHGYLKPFNLKERSRQAQIASEELLTGISWLYDPMDNQTAKALSTEVDDHVFVFNRKGAELYSGPISDAETLRKTLTKEVGEIKAPTHPDTLPISALKPINTLKTRLVKGVIIDPKKQTFTPLQIAPHPSKKPYYAKLRIEATDELLQTGNGTLYLGFHIDPLYNASWNNIADPIRYNLHTAHGVVAPSLNSAPKVKSQSTDSEPREFLLQARNLDISQPLTLQVSYSIHSHKSKKNIQVQQQYKIYLNKDPYGGQVIGRQISQPSSTSKTDPKAATAFAHILRRFDQDQNGKLSRDEVIGRLRSNFDTIDTNEDEFISVEEFSKYRTKR